MQGIFDLPDDEQRLFSDEIKGEEEYNEELRRKKATIDDEHFDLSASDIVDYNGTLRTTHEESVDFNYGRGSVLVGFRNNSNIKFEDFKMVMLLGRGTFGKVYLANLHNDATK
jgi:hypothetical protein